MNIRPMLPIVLSFLLLFSFNCASAKDDVKSSNLDSIFSNIVHDNGQLQVVNGQLCNAKGEAIQLKGMSTHGLNFCRFFTNTMNYLVKDWNIQVIRGAVFSSWDGYIGHPELNKERIKFIVDQAIQYGIYVVIDWHVIEEHDPNIYRKEAKAFFEEMATLYGKYPNVIYEICNEPNPSNLQEVTWEGQIKPYAEYIISAIRSIDPDNIIVVGTETWSQRVDKAADNPLTFSNIMYTLHFYAGTHKEELREKAEYALSKGIAIFVTEWGTTNSGGAGMLYLDEAQVWVDWMKEHKISWCNWNFSNSFEDAAALNPTTGMNGPWKDSQISESGLWVKSKLVQ